jgi:hypothetical protein
MRQILNELKSIEDLDGQSSKWDKHREDIKRWSKEIEWEEAFYGDRIQADLRHVMSMSDEELEQSILEDDIALAKLEKQDKARQRHEYQLKVKAKAKADAENQAMLDGIKQGAAKHSEKRVKQMADKQVQRVLKK